MAIGFRAGVAAAVVAATAVAASAPSPALAPSDPLIVALRDASVLVEPGTGGGAATLRAEAARLARSGYPTKFAILARPAPVDSVAYAGKVRRALGLNWSVVIVWPDGRGTQSTFAFHSPSPVGARVAREVLTQARRGPRAGIFVRVALETARRLSWYSPPRRPPVAGRLVNLDGDPELERIVKLPAGVGFPAARRVPGIQFAVTDGAQTTRIGDPGERTLAPVLGDHVGAGSPQILLRSASGNSPFAPKLVAWTGSGERVLWQPNGRELSEGLPPGRFIGGYESLAFVDLDADGVEELVVRVPVLTCRACTPEGTRVATYRFAVADSLYFLAEVRSGP